LTFSLGNFLEPNRSVIPVRITNKVSINLDMFVIQPKSKNLKTQPTLFLESLFESFHDPSETPLFLGNSMISHPWSGGKRLYCGQGEGKGFLEKLLYIWLFLETFLISFYNLFLSPLFYCFKNFFDLVFILFFLYRQEWNHSYFLGLLSRIFQNEVSYLY